MRKSSSWYIWRVISSFIDQKKSHMLYGYLVFSHEIDNQVWKLENMLKHFKQELSAEECCSSLVNEKQPSRCNKT